MKTIVEFAVLVILFVVVLSILIRIRKLGRSEAFLEERGVVLENYTATIEQLNEAIDGYRVSMIQTIDGIQDFVDQKDAEGLREFYYAHIGQNYFEETQAYGMYSKLEKLKITSLKGLILNKYQGAITKGIHFDVGIIEQLQHLEVDEVDLCRLIGILLDNAIEAAEHTEEKSVHVYMSRDEEQRHWRIEINNSSSSIAGIESQHWKSTKGSKRGIGLKSFKTIVSQYKHVSEETNILRGYVCRALIIKDREVS